jgi:hypothetical protein
MIAGFYNRDTEAHSVNRSLGRLFAVVLAFGTFCAHRSLACSCGSLPNAPGNCREWKAAGPSFVGTVIDIENPPDEGRGADQNGLSRYRFRVDENISGFEEKEVDVYSGRGGGDCSYHFRLGQSYFVTPYRRTLAEIVVPYRVGAQTGEWMAGICTETQPAASAAALLAELRARKRGSTVEGILRTKQPSSENDHGMPNITVELRGKETTLSTQTDVDGVYRFTGIHPGKYQFVVKLPPDFPSLANTPGDNPSSITIADQTCYAKDIDALRVPRIAP